MSREGRVTVGLRKTLVILWGEIEAPEAIMMVHVGEKEAWAKADRTEEQS